MPKLKLLYKKLNTKIGTATKAVLIGRILSQWQLQLFVNETDEEAPIPSALTLKVCQELSVLPPFDSDLKWGKNLLIIRDFTFMNTYTYLIESKDLRSFKSLKAYSYFSDGLVINVWLSSIEPKNLTQYIYASTLKE